MQHPAQSLAANLYICNTESFHLLTVWYFCVGKLWYFYNNYQVPGVAQVSGDTAPGQEASLYAHHESCSTWLFLGS